MVKKFYDLYVDGWVGNSPRVKTENISDMVVIECECGTHLLQVISDADVTSYGSKRSVQQSFYLAMFQWGAGKRNIWYRIKIAWKYLRTGKMFDDQLSLTADEAEKLAEFVNKNIIKNNLP